VRAAVRLPDAASPGAEPELFLMVRADNPLALRDAGFRVGTVAGTVATVTVPLSRLSELDRVPGLRHAELSRQLEPLLDVSGPAVGFDVIHGAAQPPYSGISGTGVVVGIIDTGIDFSHDDFKNEDGTNRISYIWDQTSGSSPPPAGYSYGREWGPAAINNGSSTERDTDGHGTHVSGIAAGNGRSTENPALKYTFTGGAPEAEILFVKTNFSELGVLDGVNWMMTRAGSKPIVINISLGGNFGPHDGSTTLETGLSSLSGPGRILVAAAGNERGLDLHSEAVIAALQAAPMKFVVPNYSPSGGADNEEIFLDGWYPGGSNLTFVVTSPNGHATPASTLANPVRQAATPDGTILVQQTPAPNGDRNVQIVIWDPDGVPPAQGEWTVTVQNMDGGSREIDFWVGWAILGGFSRDVPWSAPYLDPGEILTTPSTADSVLCVSAYITKTSWKDYLNRTCGYSGYTVGAIAPFSSSGPRRDGVQKPEISAPGMGIGSALSANATNPIFTDPCGKTPDGRHTVGQGTSQSSPHVAAAVALLLQVNPTLSVKAVRDILAQNADHDGYTGAGYSTSFGFGKLNVEKAVNSIVPVRLLSFTASWEEGMAVVRWELAETEPGARFTVERGPSREGPFHAVEGSVIGDLSFSWTDPDPQAGEPWYRLSVTTRDGRLKRFGATRLDPLAGELRLWQNAPNPFASSTVIAFELDRRREARVDVLDVAGRRVRTLVSGFRPAGRNEVTWDGRAAGGRAAAAGIYFYRLSTSDRVLAGRMIRTR
jgi:subtilisin family serine protease